MALLMEVPLLFPPALFLLLLQVGLRFGVRMPTRLHTLHLRWVEQQPLVTGLILLHQQICLRTQQVQSMPSDLVFLLATSMVAQSISMGGSDEACYLQL
jgi:hypothetical protein